MTINIGSEGFVFRICRKPKSRGKYMKNYLYLIVLFSMIALGIGPSRSEGKMHDKKILLSELPQPARRLLRTYFPGDRVLQCVHSRTWARYGVKVSGGYELEFDKNGRWAEIGSEHRPLSAELLDLLPRPVELCLRQNYPHSAIERMERCMNMYKLSLASPHVALYFSKSGELVKSGPD